MIGTLLLVSSFVIPSANAPVAALVHARDLLRARKYVALTRLIEDRQSAAEANPAKADQFDWTLNAFRVNDESTQKLINDWVRTSPKAWAPLLARAVNTRARAGVARGGKWASETSDSQFRRMADLDAAMTADCRSVLALNRGVCRCYTEMVMAAKNAPSDPDQLLKEAFGACPREYDLYVERIYGLAPRWGGSYAAMEMAIESARKAGLDEARVRSLRGYLPLDKASLLRVEGRPEEARKILDQAIVGLPVPLLFEERAELHLQRRDAAATLGDANVAIEMTHGGWMFSAGRLKRLLVARAWALHTLKMTVEARRDVAWANAIAPGDEHVRRVQAFIETPPARPNR